MKQLFTSLVLAMFLILSSCNSVKKESISLQEKYKDHFPIGVAISKAHLEGHDTLLIKEHFSSITCENDMKPQRTINKQGKFTYEKAEDILNLALNDDKLIRGHTLVWYNQTDNWFYRDSEGIYLSKENMFERMEWYISEVLEHYKGKVYCWDVVNEAVDDEAATFYREDIDWFQVCGPEYIEKAFVYARKADPDVKLFYNDYDLINPDKAQKVYTMVKDFQARGIPIDGIGMQGHWTLEDVNSENLSKSIDLFASLGLEVQITELDISIYPYYHNMPRETLPKEIREFTPELEQKQADKYREVFEVLREKSDIITSVTFWGLADNNTWLSNYVVKGRTDHPLLFDMEFQSKKSFDAIMDF